MKLHVLLVSTALVGTVFAVVTLLSSTRETGTSSEGAHEGEAIRTRGKVGGHQMRLNLRGLPASDSERKQQPNTKCKFNDYEIYEKSMEDLDLLVASLTDL